MEGMKRLLKSLGFNIVKNIDDRFNQEGEDGRRKIYKRYMDI